MARLCRVTSFHRKYGDVAKQGVGVRGREFMADLGLLDALSRLCGPDTNPLASVHAARRALEMKRANEEPTSCRKSRKAETDELPRVIVLG